MDLIILYKILIIFSNKIRVLKPSRSSTLDVIYPSLKVEKFLVENQTFTQLSDHYGLSVQLFYQHDVDEIYDSCILKMNNKLK